MTARLDSTSPLKRCPICASLDVQIDPDRTERCQGCGHTKARFRYLTAAEMEANRRAPEKARNARLG